LKFEKHVKNTLSCAKSTASLKVADEAGTTITSLAMGASVGKLCSFFFH